MPSNHIDTILADYARTRHTAERLARKFTRIPLAVVSDVTLPSVIAMDPDTGVMSIPPVAGHPNISNRPHIIDGTMNVIGPVADSDRHRNSVRARNHRGDREQRSKD